MHSVHAGSFTDEYQTCPVLDSAWVFCLLSNEWMKHGRVCGRGSAGDHAIGIPGPQVGWEREAGWEEGGLYM